jgi:hypothetical protein
MDDRSSSPIIGHWSQLVAYLVFVIVAIGLFAGLADERSDRDKALCDAALDRIELIEDLVEYATEPLVPPLSEQLANLGPETVEAIKASEARSDQFATQSLARLEQNRADTLERCS